MALQTIDATPVLSRGARHAALGIAVAVLLLAPKLYAAQVAGGYNLQDDAYFYLLIARNIVETGLSTFDKQTLTNGYHPLWLGLIVLQQLVTGPTILPMLVMEAVLCGLGVWLLLRTLGGTSFTTDVLVATAIFWPLSGIALLGMEISLLVGCFGWLVFLLSRHEAGPGAGADRHALLIGLAGALTIGARLDAAVFVLPLMALAPISVRSRWVALGVVAACGAAYGIINLYAFGTSVPISGAVKSLGGLQVNSRLIEQVAGGGQLDWLFVVMLFVLAAGAYHFAERSSLGAALALAFLIGIVLYVGKLLFNSSWQIWSWYWYPSILGVTAIALAMSDRIERFLRSTTPAIVAGIGVSCAVLVVVLAAIPPLDPRFMLLKQVNEAAIARTAGVLRGERVAMGDRVGSFAFAYSGGVTQLEGLVNDKAYLDVLRKGGDLRPLLCSRGVRFIVDWEKDLGDYTRFELPVLDPNLTSFPGPKLTVTRAAEVARISDLARLAPRHPVNTIYIWRLEGC